ncbi:unnamed protein product [Caretta caretta]
MCAGPTGEATGDDATGVRARGKPQTPPCLPREWWVRDAEEAAVRRVGRCGGAGRSGRHGAASGVRV